MLVARVLIFMRGYDVILGIDFMASISKLFLRQRQLHPKSTAFPHLRIFPDLAMMRFHHYLDRGQAVAGWVHIVEKRIFASPAFGIKILPVFRGNTPTRVFNIKKDLFFFKLQPDGNLAFIRVFHRVIH